MPYRDRARVLSWIDDFNRNDRQRDTTITVLEQDGEPGADSGMIVVELRLAGTITLIHPVAEPKPTWLVTFEAREYDVDMDIEGVAQLLADVQTVHDLCVYLQQRTDEAVALA